MHIPLTHADAAVSRELHNRERIRARQSESRQIRVPERMQHERRRELERSWSSSR
jgi:hypothetical protein